MIGTYINIVDSKNPTLIGLNGVVLDETKYSIMIQTKFKNKIVLKNHLTKLEIFENNKIKIINGKSTIGRHEDRLLK